MISSLRALTASTVTAPKRKLCEGTIPAYCDFLGPSMEASARQLIGSSSAKYLNLQHGQNPCLTGSPCPPLPDGGSWRFPCLLSPQPLHTAFSPPVFPPTILETSVSISLQGSLPRAPKLSRFHPQLDPSMCLSLLLRNY